MILSVKTWIFENYPLAHSFELWKQLYKERTAVERVNAYLKQ